MKTFHKYLATALAVSLSGTSLAFDASVCDTNSVFSQYDCTICHTADTIEAQMSDGSYTAQISNIEFEWENLSDQFNELIYDDEQEYPTVHANVSIAKDPTREDSFWSYGEQVLWTEYEGVNEYYTDPGMKLIFRKSKPSSKIMVDERVWQAEEPSVLVKAPLIFREMDIESFEESDKQVRNYCLLYPLTADTTVTPDDSGSDDDQDDTSTTQNTNDDSSSTTSSNTSNTSSNSNSSNSNVPVTTQEDYENDEEEEELRNVLDGSNSNLNDGSSAFETFNSSGTTSQGSQTYELNTSAPSEVREDDDIELNAAGPAPTQISSSQTKTPTGTEHIVLAIIALLGGGLVLRKKLRV